MRKLVIICLLVMLVTAGGTEAARRLITSADIKNGTIRPVDLSAATKRTMRGSRGLAGQPGPEGPQGPQGVPGPPGIQRIIEVKTVKTIAPGAVDSVVASCPSGMAVVSGGWTIISAYAVPFFEFGRVSWYVGVDNFGAPSSAEATAYAYCSPNITTFGPANAGEMAERLIAERRSSRLAR